MTENEFIVWFSAKTTTWQCAECLIIFPLETGSFRCSECTIHICLKCRNKSINDKTKYHQHATILELNLTRTLLLEIKVPGNDIKHLIDIDGIKNLLRSNDLEDIKLESIEINR